MTVELVPFEPHHLPAVRRLVERAYRRPRTDAFHRWSYLAPPAHVAFLALRDGECLAVLRAFARPYRLGAERVTCLETFDWYTAPEHRRHALGIRVIREAMTRPEPLINVGGTPDSLALLPRLGWSRIAEVRSYVLPLSLDALRREGRPDAPLLHTVSAAAARAWLRAVGRPPPGAEAVPVGVPGEDVARLYEGRIGHGTLPLPDVGHLRWLTGGFPGTGQFITLYFAVRDHLRGWGMLRLSRGPAGPEASLVEVYAPNPEVRLYRWMIAELVARGLAYRPVVVRAMASSPVLGAALRRAGFRPRATSPVQMWSRERRDAPRPSHFTLNTQDQPLLPYPERWTL